VPFHGASGAIAERHFDADRQDFAPRFLPDAATVQSFSRMMTSGEKKWWARLGLNQ
jgi:hypothetical protein